MKRFQLALVTGATSGLGLALAQLLSHQNIPLLLTGRDPERLARAARLPGVVATCALDLATNRQPLIDLIRRYTPDLVVNNAGCGLYGPALLYPTAQQLQILEVNAAAAIEIALEAARALRSANRTGAILNVSSAAGELPIPTLSLYAAAKACLTSFSQSFDAEMRPYGIRVLAALPGPIATPFASRASNNDFRQTSRFALSPEQAARSIWRQIQKNNPLHIPSLSHRLGLLLLKLLPRLWTNRLFEKSLRNRWRY